MLMTVTINGNSLKIDELVNVARNSKKIELSEKSWKRIDECREMLEKKIEDNEIIYGTNTGIGEFSEIALDQEQLKEFQKYLIYSHAAGIGDPMDIEIVRGAMCGRVNVHAKGYSAGRRIVTERMIEALNRGITPVVCDKGSVGACGDLYPMSQIALAIMGEGEVFYKGEKNIIFFK